MVWAIYIVNGSLLFTYIGSLRFALDRNPALLLIGNMGNPAIRWVWKLCQLFVYRNSTIWTGSPLGICLARLGLLWYFDLACIDSWYGTAWPALIFWLACINVLKPALWIRLTFDGILPCVSLNMALHVVTWTDLMDVAMHCYCSGLAYEWYGLGIMDIPLCIVWLCLMDVAVHCYCSGLAYEWYGLGVMDIPLCKVWLCLMDVACIFIVLTCILFI